MTKRRSMLLPRSIASTSPSSTVLRRIERASTPESSGPAGRVPLGGLALVILGSSLGCGGGDTSTGTSTTGLSPSTTTGGQGGESGTTTASSSSGLSTSSSTGTGAGGAPPTAGAPGSETVSAGQLCTSPSYRMIMTLGQPTQNQGLTTSPGYRMRGGLVGSTQK